MKTRFEIRSVTFGPLALTAAFLVASAVAVPKAEAQVSGFYESDNPAVTIDMSVIDGGGAAGSARSFPSPAVGALAVPGPTPPVSRLHIKPDEPMGKLPAPAPKVVMTPPAAPPESSLSAPEKETPEAPAPKTAAAPPPPKPKPTQTAKAEPSAPPPAPTTEPETKPAEQMPVASAEPAPSSQPPAPPPPPEGMGAEPAEPAQQASLPPADMALEPGKAMQVAFETNASKLPDDRRDDLKSLVAKIAEQPNLRLQLLAYAGGESLSSSKARRLSLSRALSVRSFLIENGLRSTRIDVRALGNKTTEQPVNRVDINIVER